MCRKNKFQSVVRCMTGYLNSIGKPFTVKMRTEIKVGKNFAHELIPFCRDNSVDMVDGLKSYRLEQLDSRNRILSSGAVDGLEHVPLNCSIQAIIMTAALLRSSRDIHTIVSDMLIVKQLQVFNFFSN